MVDKPRYSNHFRRMAVDIKISNYIGKYLKLLVDFVNKMKKYY